MLHAGLDLSRRKLDVWRALARRIDEAYREPVCAVIESMTGARLVHDTLEQEGWEVEIADAQKVKGLAPLACKTDTSPRAAATSLTRTATANATRCPRDGAGVRARLASGIVETSTLSRRRGSRRCSEHGRDRQRRNHRHRRRPQVVDDRGQHRLRVPPSRRRSKAARRGSGSFLEWLAGRL
jgi:hypothetical protein